MAGGWLGLILGVLLSGPEAQADAVFSLQSNGSGLAGSSGTLALTIAGAPASAGFNAHIVLPTGITVAAVSAGSLLTAAGNFTVQWHQSGVDLKVVGYSATATYSGGGELAVLQMAVAGNSPAGQVAVGYALNNANALVNSRHALSNDTGSQSLPHTVSPSTQNFLVYSSTSDFDADGLPDRWEVANKLNPLSTTGNNGALADGDNDGVSNLNEFRTGTDPGNGLSRAEGSGEGANRIDYVLFRDHFNDNQYEDRWFITDASQGIVSTLIESGSNLDVNLGRPVNGCGVQTLRSQTTVDAVDAVYHAKLKLEGRGLTTLGLMQGSDFNNRVELLFAGDGSTPLRMRVVEKHNGTPAETLETAEGAPSYNTNAEVDVRLVKRGVDYYLFVDRMLRLQMIQSTMSGLALRPYLTTTSCNTDTANLLSHIDVVEVLRDTDADGRADLHEDLNLDGATSTGESNRTVADTDADGQLDGFDNCLLTANADQRNVDGDAYGSLCDPDFDNNGAINFADLAQLKSRFFTSDPNADLNGDGAVNFADLALLKSMFFKSPGPSGLTTP